MPTEEEIKIKFPVGTMIEIKDWLIIPQRKYTEERSGFLIVSEYIKEPDFCYDPDEGTIEGDFLMYLYEPKTMQYHEYDPFTLNRMFEYGDVVIIHNPEKPNET